MESTQMSTDRGMNKKDVVHIYNGKNVVHIYNGILLSHKKEWNNVFLHQYGWT